VAASLFASVAHDWLHTRLEAPTEGPPASTARAKVVASCAKVAGAIVNASAGDEMKVLSYMQTVCDRHNLQKQSAELCSALGIGLVRAMKRDPECNRRINVSEVCRSFYQGPLADMAQLERTRRQQAPEHPADKTRSGSHLSSASAHSRRASSGPAGLSTNLATGHIPAAAATTVHVAAVVAAAAASGPRVAEAQVATVVPAALQRAAVATEHEPHHQVEEQVHENEKREKGSQPSGDAKSKITTVLSSFASVGHRMSTAVLSTAENVLPDGFVDNLMQTFQASVPTALWSRIKGDSP